MSNPLIDVLLVNVRIINKASQRFKRAHAGHNGLEGAFPPVLSEKNIDLVQFKATPHLKGDILVDIGTKKTIFEAHATYTEGDIALEVETRLLYAYERLPFSQPPKAVFYWEHNATSVGRQNIACRSFLRKHSRIYPYNYSIDFLIG